MIQPTLRLLLITILATLLAATSCARTGTSLSDKTDDPAALWSNLHGEARRLHDEGNYTVAAEVAKKALQVAEDTFGPEDTNVAATLNLLGLIYQKQGKPGDAEAPLERTLAIIEQARGPNHPDVAAICNNLAGAHKAQGEYAEAAPLYERALSITKESQGSEDPAVAVISNNLAGMYSAQSRYEEAEFMYLHALTICEKHLGHEDTQTTQVRNNLKQMRERWLDDLSSERAALLRKKQYPAATAKAEKAVEVAEQAFGGFDAKVAAAHNRLGILRYVQESYDEAETEFQRAVRIKVALGQNDASLAAYLRNLGHVYEHQERYEQSAEQLVRAGEIYWTIRDDSSLESLEQIEGRLLNLSIKSNEAVRNIVFLGAPDPFLELREPTADAEHPQNFASGGLQLRYPGNWTVIVTRHDHDDIVHALEVRSPGGSYINFTVTKGHGDVHETSNFLHDAYAGALKNPSERPFNRYGDYKGEGFELTGTVSDTSDIYFTVRTFTANIHGYSVVVIGLYPQNQLEKVTDGFALVEDSFSLR